MIPHSAVPLELKKFTWEVDIVLTSIKNDLIEIAVDTYGAELTSIKTVKDSLEYLWQKDDNYWARQAPPLFPIVGGLPDDRYQLGGQTYEMKLHGFARWCEFTLISSGPEELVYCLGHSEESLRQYPFKFEFLVKYKLEANTLRQSFQVNNLDEKTMFFAVGSHPGFRCPLYEGEKMEDYYLLFEKPEQIRGLVESQGLLTGETKAFLDRRREKPLSHSMFGAGELTILKEPASKWLELRNRVNDRRLRLGFEEFSYIGLWSRDNAPFVCIEPWLGIHPTIGDSLDFETKREMQKLWPKESFECGFSVTVE
jgi:galactose mutarotase-like enzyme